jgi:hypothetical protein
MGLTVCLFIILGSVLPIMILVLWAIYWKRYKQFIWLIAFTWTDLQLGQAYIAFYRKQFMLMWLYLLGWIGLAVYSYVIYRRLKREKKL